MVLFPVILKFYIASINLGAFNGLWLVTRDTIRLAFGYWNPMF